MVIMPRARSPEFLRASLLALSLAGFPSALAGQATSAYLTYYNQLREMRPLKELTAPVRGLTLKRDAAELVFEEGRMWLMTPVNGRTIGVAFEGTGWFRYAPASIMERERLRDMRKMDAMDQPFSQVVLLFGDSTLEQLRAQLTFGPGEESDALRRRFVEALSYVGKEDHQSVDPDLVISLMNDQRTDLFYAHMAHRADPWVFMINPHEVEGVRLLGRPRGVGWIRYAEIVTQSRRNGEDPMTTSEERTPEPFISQYEIETWMTQDVTGGLRFAAAARVEINTTTAAGPWVSFILYDKLEVDSARLDSGEHLEVFKAKDDYSVFLNLRETLLPGTPRAVTLYYHGPVIDAFGEWFYVESSIAWYPVSMEGRAKALFDITFHHPRSLTLASVGERVDSSLAGIVETSRWVTRRPIRNASFNLGIFDAVEIKETDLPPITLLSSEKGHREQFGGGASFGTITRRVSADIAAAMKFFQSVFGPSPVSTFYATEIPAGHGEAFPGMINLSYVTFAPNRDDGFDEFFRGHEVAHQWWGIGVDYATYHDRWISEGFSSFAGLWFLQTRRGDNKRYFDQLERFRADIMLRREQALPVWLGHRVATARTGDDYRAIVYMKGAWVLHMLRMLMLDLLTMNEDRFTTAMREFYQSFAGGRASTEDFRKAIERHVGTDMRWFFNQWIYRPEIPTYRYNWRSERQPDGQYKVRLRVRQENVGPEFLMFVPVTVDMGGNRVARARVRITGAETEVEFPAVLPSEPRAVKFNDMAGVLAEVRTMAW
jgi:Peptidase family M1 domain